MNRARITWSSETMRLGDLVPWRENPRMSSKRQAQKIIESFEKFGQVQTIAVSPKNDVYDGHQRLSALLTVHGDDFVVDVRRASRNLTDDERRRLVVTLHAGASGAWDWDVLAGWDDSLITDAGLDNVFAEQLKRDARAIHHMLDAARVDVNECDTTDDALNAAQKKWRVKQGDVWSLGANRLMCGDSSSETDVRALVDESRVDVIATDPPYDVDASDVLAIFSRFADRAVVLSGGKQAFSLFNDSWRYSFDLVFQHRAPRSFPTEYMPVLYHHNIVFIVKKKARLGWRRPRADYGSVVTVDGDEFEKTVLGHAKGYSVFVEMLRGFDAKTCADPFAGSFPCALACAELGKTCVGMEIDARTVAVALNQWLLETGEKPKLINRV